MVTFHKYQLFVVLSVLVWLDWLNEEKIVLVSCNHLVGLEGTAGGREVICDLV